MGAQLGRARPPPSAGWCQRVDSARAGPPLTAPARDCPRARSGSCRLRRDGGSAHASPPSSLWLRLCRAPFPGDPCPLLCSSAGTELVLLKGRAGSRGSLPGPGVGKEGQGWRAVCRRKDEATGKDSKAGARETDRWTDRRTGRDRPTEPTEAEVSAPLEPAWAS